MPRAKRKRKRSKALIPKEWTTKDGITTLPVTVKVKVEEVLNRLKIGANQQANFFGQKFTPSERQHVAYELSLGGISYQDISMLLDVSLSGAFMILERARAEVAARLPHGWLVNNFVDDYQAIKSAAQWNKSRAESATSDELAVSFSRNEIAARGKSIDALLKGAEVAKQLKGDQQGEGDKPDPSNRVSLMQWVFENRILPKLEPPKETEAEIVNDGLQNQE